MPKQDNPLARIREHANIQLGGFGRSGSVPATRVIELPADQVPEGAEVVASDTPLSDWTETE